jgi:hypothetical protein
VWKAQSCCGLPLFRHLDSSKEEAKKAVSFFWRDFRSSTRALLFFGYAESLHLFHRELVALSTCTTAVSYRSGVESLDELLPTCHNKVPNLSSPSANPGFAAPEENQEKRSPRACHHIVDRDCWGERKRGTSRSGRRVKSSDMKIDNGIRIIDDMHPRRTSHVHVPFQIVVPPPVHVCSHLSNKSYLHNTVIEFSTPKSSRIPSESCA